MNGSILFLPEIAVFVQYLLLFEATVVVKIQVSESILKLRYLPKYKFIINIMKAKVDMGLSLREKIKGKEIWLFVDVSAMLLYLAAFLLASPQEIVEGMKAIIYSKDALITDYFKLAGYGAAFFNAASVLTLGIILLKIFKVPLNGLMVSSLFIDVCFGLWGKNIINMVPILIGVLLYTKFHKEPLGKYIHTAFLGACLGPVVTEVMYKIPLSFEGKLIGTLLVGILIGAALPPLASHTMNMHMGYNLFNTGFAAGILAFGIVCVMRSFNMEVEPVFIWQDGFHPGITIGVYLYFICCFIYGLWLSNWKFAAFLDIWRFTGRCYTDFLAIEGPGATLMNMATIGLVAETYILLIGGDLSGPIQGAVIMAFGYGAFGVHIKNYVPVLVGVYLSCFVTQYTPVTPGIQIASIFCVGLAPLAGHFGNIAGIVAGFFHTAIVMYTSNLYGGLNLYNNGFSAGLVAILMVPIMENVKMRANKKEAEE